MDVVGGVGSVPIPTRFKQVLVCIKRQLGGSPTYDYYTFDEFDNPLWGKTGVSGVASDATDVTEAASGSFEIINSTLDGKYDVTLYSELAQSARIQR